MTQFKNSKLEQGFRKIAHMAGISDERFNECVERDKEGDFVFINEPGASKTLLTFSTSLLAKEFDYYDWNYKDVLPPKENENATVSIDVLLEDEKGIPHKAYYDFMQNKWIDFFNGKILNCNRHRAYPY